ncbi:MAG: hypothetical protein K2Q18_00560 [Bdellovibrionales bacterium]|nr:hypothetical protein [Bdellovibrionales bacterium]
MKKILTLLFFAILTSCSSPQKHTYTQKTATQILEKDSEIMDYAILSAAPSGKKVLETSKNMIDDQSIVIGGCWHYINAVYNYSGFDGKKRKTIFKSKFKGPYAETSLIEAGDWLYFVNHTFNDIEHSAIFIAWIDQDKKEALMVNYVGGNRKTPGTFKRFILDSVYNIIRAE